nr:ribonuclease H-like domain-containing protein [Tanacetum cinerariifolium]
FTRDNNCTIEFDAFGFSVTDYLTRHIILRCDNSGNLYPVTKPSTSPIAFLSISASTWHQRLGHPGDQVLFSLVSSRFISYLSPSDTLLPFKVATWSFNLLNSIVEHCFDIIHSNLWTSPIAEMDKEQELRQVYRDCWAATWADSDEHAVRPYTQPTVRLKLWVAAGDVASAGPLDLGRVWCSK